MTSWLYSWRYQLPTDVAEHSPGGLEREARKAAVRDALHDGWTPAAPPLVNTYEAEGLDGVTDVVVTFAVTARNAESSPQDIPDRCPLPELLPAKPLVDLVGNRSVVKLFTVAQRRAFYHGRARGWFTLNAADKLAVALGHTLETIWTDQAASQTPGTLASSNAGGA